MPHETVLTIGNFDGVHTGHAALVRKARELAAARPGHARVVALAFHPHPLTLLRPEQAPATLTTFDRRAELLIQLGCDAVERLDPTPELLALTPQQFVERIVQRLNPVAIVEGPDFRFGHARAGDNATLAHLGRSRGFFVHTVEPVMVELSDQTLATASSTLVRWLLGAGRVEDAARVLSRPYELAGVVVRGDQRGRAIGFPTANLSTPTMLPADAVYAGRALLPDGRTRPAAIHVGTRSTFNDTTRTVEAYIMDWPGPVAEGTPEYGWPLRLTFDHWLRDQVKFESVPALVEQIHRDVARVARFSREAGGRSPGYPAAAAPPVRPPSEH